MATQTYDFESDTLSQAPADITFVRGSGTVVDVSGDKTLNLVVASNRCDAVLDLIPDSSTNFVVDFVSTVTKRPQIVAMTNANVDTGYMMQWDAAGDNRIEIYRRNPASPYSHTLLRQVTIPSTTDDKWRASATVSDGVVTLTAYSWDGAAWVEVPGLSVTDSTYTNGMLAIGCSTNSNAQFGEVSVEYDAPQPVTITTPADDSGIQRDDSDLSVIDVPASGAYTGSPDGLERRIDGGSWSTFDAAPSGDTWSTTLGHLATGEHTLEVRWTNHEDNADRTASVTFVVGDGLLLIGQSNTEGRLTSGQTYFGTQPAKMYRQSQVWSALSDPTDSDVLTGSPWPVLASLISLDQDVPVFIITAANGNTSLGTAASPGDWYPTVVDDLYAAAVAQFTASGAGAVRGVIWHQGESDANSGVSRSDYLASLQTLASAIATDIASHDGSDVPLIVTQLGYKTTGSVTRDNLDAIRLAQSDAWEYSNIVAGPTLYDVGPLSDGVHFATVDEGTTLSRRHWLCVDAALYDGTVAAPEIDSAVLNSARTAVSISTSVPLDANVTVYGAAGWIVAVEDVAQTIESVTLSGGKIVIALSAAAPAGDVIVSYASFNDAAGLVVPHTVPATLPDDTTAYLPLIPATNVVATEAAFAVVDPVTVDTEIELISGDTYNSERPLIIDLPDSLGTIAAFLDAAEADSETIEWSAGSNSRSGLITGTVTRDPVPPAGFVRLLVVITTASLPCGKMTWHAQSVGSQQTHTFARGNVTVTADR